MATPTHPTPPSADEHAAQPPADAESANPSPATCAPTAIEEEGSPDAAPSTSKDGPVKRAKAPDPALVEELSTAIKNVQEANTAATQAAQPSKVTQLQHAIAAGDAVLQAMENKTSIPSLITALGKKGLSVTKQDLSRYRGLATLNALKPLSGIPNFGYTDALTLLRAPKDPALKAVLDRASVDPSLRATALTAAVREARREAEAAGVTAPTRRIGTSRGRLEVAMRQVHEAFEAAVQDIAHATSPSRSHDAAWQEEAARLEAAISQALTGLRQLLALRSRPTTGEDEDGDE